MIILLFSGGGSNKLPNNSRTLVSYANTDAKARLTIDAPIKDPAEHQQIQITVDRDTISLELLKGYDGEVTNVQSFPNSQNSFDVFLHSLSVANFTHGNTDKSLKDERGYCPLGDRYIFELLQDGSSIERFWATSCGSPKTYYGNVNLTLLLFENQVPNYSDLTQNVNLYD
ncbi:MAG TPA: hypothetical protein VHB51_00050 [Candidatus Saccharimonadales bacterium]|nr:hypothetical protein [Candidatus Saccharimonadales bacterium]